MKIGIDARFLGPEGTGIGRYVEKLIENLEQIDSFNQYTIFLRKSNFHLYSPKSPNFQKITVDADWYSLKEQILLPKIISQIKPDLMHFPHYNVPYFPRANFIVTIYDLTKLEFRKDASNLSNPLTYQIKQTLLKILLKKAVKDSKAIIAGSNSTKEKLISLLNVPGEKIHTVYAGADDFLHSEKKGESESSFLTRIGVKKPFILYVGNAAPYKNVSIIIEALKQLKNFQFVYVSSRNVFVERLIKRAESIGVADRVVTTGYISDQNLSSLYKEAECFVFPSFSEGFGLPPLEAMASSCPVICSDIPVLREVFGDAAVYFDPKDHKDLVEKVRLVNLNKSLRVKLLQKGSVQVRKYSWEKLARETLKVYSEILNR